MEMIALGRRVSVVQVESKACGVNGVMDAQAYFKSALCSDHEREDSQTWKDLSR